MKKRFGLGILVILLVAAGVVAWKWQAVSDWAALRNYTPPTAISQLATEDTMTPKAEHLLYVNHPDLSMSIPECPSGGEKTVVLGCYLSPDRGIYIYKVTDSRLTGVEQVTAAHEMLHAAYRRLSSKERTYVDGLLLNYYHHDLTDQRIKDTIAAYKQSEPNDVVNEMHSVFGTEVANLPPALEVYYSQYFTKRSVVTGFTAQYQGEFTSRRNQVSAYDTQLSSLKQQVEGDETQLKQQKSALDSQSAQLTTLKNDGQITAYNAAVGGYNQAVDTYNALLASTKDAINQYNTIVGQRNQVVLEEQQLTKELSSNSLSAGK